MINDDDTFHADAETSSSERVADNNCTDAAAEVRQLSDALKRKLSLLASTDQCRPDVTSSSCDNDGPPRFWSPSCERRRENRRPTAATSMFDFRSVELPDFRSKSSPSPASSTADESAVARRCTQELCCEYFRKFIAFLFSTVGSCCLMVGYVILGGVIFRHLEAEPGRVVDVDMQRVKEKHIGWLCRGVVQHIVQRIVQQVVQHVGWLWNLTAKMNVLHPHDWSTAAIDVLNSYTTQVSVISTRFFVGLPLPISGTYALISQ